MSELSEWELGVEGNFPIHKAVVKGISHFTGYPRAGTDTNLAVFPRGTKIMTADSCGISAWTKTAKVSVILPNGSPKRYFLKVDLSTLVC